MLRCETDAAAEKIFADLKEYAVLHFSPEKNITLDQATLKSPIIKKAHRLIG